MTPERQAIHDKRWWTLAVLCGSLMVISIDNTILNVAIPSIVQELGAEGSDLQWIVDAYIIVFAGLLLTAGSLGDKLGRKGILTAGLVLFGACSALASTADSPEMLIASRALMGIGGALIFPTTLSIISNTFDGEERAKAIGIWAGVTGLGVAIGPLAGGLLVEHFWWGSVFLVNVPVCIAAVVAGRFLVPTSRNPHDSRLDPVGALLSIGAMGGLLFAVIEVPVAGWTDPRVVTGAVAGLAFGGLFVWWEVRTPNPMLDLRYFRNPRFSAASATITLTYFALIGSTFLLTQYFQFALDYSPFEAGLLTAPIALGIMATAPNTPRLVRRWGTKWVVVVGLGVVAAGMCLYGSDQLMSFLPTGALIRLVFGIGMGLVVAPATESIMGSLPVAHAGVGSAVNDTTRQAGGAIGVAVVGSVFAARYRGSVVVPDGLPADRVPLVRDSIGTAFEAARGLPNRAGAIREAALDSFLGSFRLTMVLAAAVIMVAAGVAWRFLPARPPGSPAPDPGPDDHVLV